MCFTLRLHMSAAPPRGGLTQALGGRKAFCSCVIRNGDSSASVGIALRTVLGRVAASVKSAMRAHTSHASRCPASEATVFICRLSASDPRLRKRPAEGSREARSSGQASVFGRFGRISASRGSVPPNKSFKPTPHRGVNSVLYATLHAVATPPWGGLTQALGGRKTFSTYVLSREALPASALLPSDS